MDRPSPFPGMDPYLEGRWSSVHAKLGTLAVVDLNTRLPPGLFADVEEHTSIIPAEDRPPGWRKPDVQVTDNLGGGVAVAPRAAIKAPLVLKLLEPEPETEYEVRIVGGAGDRVVTAIEFISPSNKKVPGLADYRRKRAALLRGGASVVEVDLVREGNWRRLLGRVDVGDDAATSYRVTTRLPDERDRVYLTPIRLRDRLPEIDIPLRPGDPRVTLDLQALLERTYAVARYGERIDYREPPDPPLDRANVEWALGLIARWTAAR